MIAIEKVLKAAVTIVAICGVDSLMARWFAFMFLGPVWITFKRLLCLKSQPLCVQFFVSMFFISCSFMVRHVHYSLHGDGDLISRELVALFPIFVYTTLFTPIVLRFTQSSLPEQIYCSLTS